MPQTLMLAENADLSRAMDELGLPLVVKIPDGSFSRGVHKVNSPEEFKRVVEELFEETDLLLAQKFMPTEFDWRGGGARGVPPVVVPNRVGRGPWQAVEDPAARPSRDGGVPTCRADPAPPARP